MVLKGLALGQESIYMQIWRERFQQNLVWKDSLIEGSNIHTKKGLNKETNKKKHLRIFLGAVTSFYYKNIRLIHNTSYVWVKVWNSQNTERAGARGCQGFSGMQEECPIGDGVGVVGGGESKVPSLLKSWSDFQTVASPGIKSWRNDKQTFSQWKFCLGIFVYNSQWLVR